MFPKMRLHYKKISIILFFVSYFIFIAPLSSQSSGFFWRDQILREQTSIPKPDLHRDAILSEAFSYEIRGHLQKALAAYQKYFQTGGEGAFARMAFARSLSRRGDWKRALEEIDRAILLSPENSDYAVFKVLLLRKRGREKKALAFALEKSTSYLRTIPGLEFHLGELYYKRNEKQKALFHFHQLVSFVDRNRAEAHSYLSVAYWRLALLYLQKKDFLRVREFLEKYLQLNPENPFARFVYVRYALFPLGEFVRAQKELRLLSSYGLRRLRQARINLRSFVSYKMQTCYLLDDLCFGPAINWLQSHYKLNLLESALLLERQKRDRRAMRILLPSLQRKPAQFVVRIAFLRILRRGTRPDLYLESLLAAIKHSLAFQRPKLAIRFLKEFEQALAGEGLFADALVKNCASSVPSEASREGCRKQLFHRFGRVPALEFLLVYFQKRSLYFEKNKEFYRASLDYKKHISLLDWYINEMELALESKKSPYSQKDLEALQKRRSLALLQRVRLFLGTENPDLFELAKRILDEDLLKSGGKSKDLAVSLRGILAYVEADWPTSKSYLKKGLELRPRDPFLAYLLALVRQASNDTSEFTSEDVRSGKYIDVYLGKYKSDTEYYFEAHNSLAYHLAKQKRDFASALRHIGIALARFPIRVRYLDTLGYLYYRKGEFRKARYYLEAAVALRGFSGDKHYAPLLHLGDAYAALGLSQQAQNFYERSYRALQQKFAPEKRIRPMLADELEQKKRLEKLLNLQ